MCKAHERTSNADTTVFRPPHEAELLSESKELNVNFQDLESFLADPDPHDLMRIRPRHPNCHFEPVSAWFTCPLCMYRGSGDQTKLGYV